MRPGEGPRYIADMRGQARTLRKYSTDAERRLWSALRHRRLAGYKFRRQHSIGRFIVDFACTRHRLIVEADGGQHNENGADAQRTAWFERQGWRVLRFWNNDILSNTPGVIETIVRALEDPHPARSRDDAARRA